MNYKKLLKPFKEDMLSDLGKFIECRSDYDESTVTKKTPFGKGVDNALAFVAELGKKEGFEVDRCDGYATELTIGSGKKLISIFAHADVVPATGDWTTEPYKLDVRDGRLYGRGTSDDKGPFIAAFYGVKALKDNNLIKDCRVRLVVGGDEERGSGCLEHYFHVLKKEDPTYGFTPDSAFPIIYGEKNISGFVSEISLDLSPITKMNGGVVPNAVIDKMDVYLPYDEGFLAYLRTNKIEYVLSNDKKSVSFIGVACHGANPKDGKNAGIIALKAISEYFNKKDVKELVNKISDTTGKAFNCYFKSKLLGETTFCIGIMKYEKGKLTYVNNFRYPENGTVEETVKKYDEAIGTKSVYKGTSPALLFDPKSPIVRTLVKAYRKESHDYCSKPLFTGGGTYAKECKNTVAFGASFPGQGKTMHMPDEELRVKDFYKMAVIYARAVHALMKLEEK